MFVRSRCLNAWQPKRLSAHTVPVTLLVILNKYQILLERLNNPFRRNPLKISDCLKFNPGRSVPGFRASRPCLPSKDPRHSVKRLSQSVNRFKQR